MELLSQKVRKDWQVFQQLRREKYNLLWRRLQLLVLGIGLVTLLSVFIDLPWPWKEIIHMSVSSGLLLGISLSTFPNGQANRRLFLAIIATTLFLLILLIEIFNPIVLPADAMNLFREVVPLMLVVPLASWLLIWRLSVDFPTQARRFSLRSTNWFQDIMVGLMGGTTLGMHLLFMATFLPTVQLPTQVPSPAVIIWAFCGLAGIVIPAEEIFFRGLVFSIQYDEFKNSFWATVLRVTLLDVLIYLILILDTTSLPFGLLLLFYRVFISVINCYIVVYRRSLIPGIMINLTFSLFVGQMFFL